MQIHAYRRPSVSGVSSAMYRNVVSPWVSLLLPARNLAKWVGG